MYRKQSSLPKQLFAATMLALAVSGVARADDSSMSMWTGDSYAYFDNLDYSAGHFNVARVDGGRESNATAKSPRFELPKRQKPVMLAERPARFALPNPFRDDTGA